MLTHFCIFTNVTRKMVLFKYFGDFCKIRAINYLVTSLYIFQHKHDSRISLQS